MRSAFARVARSRVDPWRCGFHGAQKQELFREPFWNARGRNLECAASVVPQNCPLLKATEEPDAGNADPTPM